MLLSGTKAQVYMLNGNKALIKAYLLNLIPELGWDYISTVVDKKRVIHVPVLTREKLNANAK